MKERTTQCFSVGLLCLLIVQNTTAVLLARHTRTKYNYNVNHMLLVSEIIKLFASCVLEHFQQSAANKNNNHHNRSSLIRSLKIHISENPRDALKLSIPAGLYLLQNSLVYHAISLVPVPLFQITQQTKLVTTAFLSVVVMKRSYNSIQWLSILSLCFGVAICILSSASNDNDNDESDDLDDTTKTKNNAASSADFGLLLLMVSNLSSSIAGIYFELVIKAKKSRTSGNEPPSIWMRNMQLAVFTICIISTKLVISKMDNDKKTLPFFFDFTPLVWFQISVLAFGGLLVASAIKYTDSAQKGLATGVSVITSSALSMMIEPRGRPPLGFVLGSALAVAGCFFFTNSDVKYKCKTRRARNQGYSQIIGAKLEEPGIKGIHKSLDCFGRKWLRLNLAAILLLSIMANVFHLQRLFWEHSRPDSVHLEASIAPPLPVDWKNHIHICIMMGGSREGSKNYGGWLVLWELFDSISENGVSVSGKVDKWELADPISENKTIVFVYPEGIKASCKLSVPHVHVRWILAPLGLYSDEDNYKHWGEDDLVFNYATSTAFYPERLPPSNILQVITSPTIGDEYDLPMDILNKADRNGTAWLMRKGKHWHKKIDYIHKKLPGPQVEVKNPSVKDFLNVEYFVSYDPYTFYTYTAAMAGAISIVHPVGNLTKREWVSGTYVGEYMKETGAELPGVAYGYSKEELEYAKRTMRKTREYMMKVRAWGKQTTVERFLRDSYKYAIGEREHFEGALLVRDAYPINSAIT